ncbi:hypothetical protein [Pedococcus sp. 2YAF34]|uniref:hypothetical protein n=1 Tax=Pedococcus sp. 2YAF34 TaxID=3233032 RepID=UPI003F980735
MARYRGFAGLVRHEFGGYGSKEGMEKAFAATGAFNAQLKADGYGRPVPRSEGVHRRVLVVDAPDPDVALELAAEGSKA